MRAWILLLAASGAQARVVEALVFPGGAELQREAVVAAGSTEAVFACIPARIVSNAASASAQRFCAA